jgi:muramoyltetrapeptide carboxypeptidase LdcA involved in peptidoglycan recycling
MEVLDRFESSLLARRRVRLRAARGVRGGGRRGHAHHHHRRLQLQPVARPLDYDLIRESPKVLCGFSDITALATATHAKTGLVTYSGPHFSTFSMERGLRYTLDDSDRCLMRDGLYEVEPADHWSDEPWYLDRDNRELVPNPGYEVLNQEARGTLLGGNLGTLALLFGRPYMTDLEGTILLLEDDEEIQPHHFDRTLQSLLDQRDFEGVRGIVLGRFQRASNMNRKTLAEIVRSRPELDNIPVVANASFGHTTPAFTFPIGGTGALRAHAGKVGLRIETH